MPLPHQLEALLPSALLTLALCAPASRAAAQCRVEVLGPAASAWESAARAVPPLGREDCSTLRLDTDETGARLTFITRDGRRAERQLSEPDELVPAATALRVTGLPPTAANAGSPSTPTAATDPSVTEPEEDPESAEWILGLSSGARGGGGSLLSPLISGSVGLAFARWEFGLSASYEPRYFHLRGRTGEDHQSGTAGIGLSLGRREPLGDLSLLWGGRVSGAVLTRKLHTSEGPADGSMIAAAESSAFEGRLGLYLGLAVPAGAGVRFRTEIGADLVGTSKSRTSIPGRPGADVAPTPEWALSASAGLEIAP